MLSATNTINIPAVERNCEPTNEALIKQFNLTETSIITNVAINDLLYIIRTSEPSTTWMRIFTGACHEYMVEIISSIQGNEQFRIWQADADGFSIKEWMIGHDSDSQDTIEIIRSRATRYLQMFREKLKQWKYPQSRDLSNRINSNCDAATIEALYRESRCKYGISQILNIQLMTEFLNVPCAIGGGIGIFNDDNRKLSKVQLYH